MNPHTQARQPSPPPPAVTAGKAETDSRLRKKKTLSLQKQHLPQGDGPRILRRGEVLIFDTSVMKNILRVQACQIIPSLCPISITERRGESEKTSIFLLLYSPGLRRIYQRQIQLGN